ncbi:hypothetical protein D3C76_1794690 [compost metagenome]
MKAEVIDEELNKLNEFRKIAQNEGIPFSSDQAAGEIALSILEARKHKGTAQSMINKADQLRNRVRK